MAKTKVHGEYLDPSVISAQTEVTAVGSDHMLIFDATDNALKKALLSDLIETVGSTPTFTSLTVDDITINGSTISDAGDLTLDVGGDIILNADGNDIFLEDGSTRFGKFSNDNSSLQIKSEVSNKDIIFKGNDGGSSITALTLDMSDAGTAVFNSYAKFSDNQRIVMGAGTDLSIYSDGTDGNIDGASKIKLDAADEIHLDSDSGIIRIKDDAGDIGMFQMTNADFIIRSMTSDKDIIFKGNDGGSVITALTLDMSNAGTATFNAGVLATALDITSTTPKVTFVESDISKQYEIGSFGGAWAIRDSNAGQYRYTLDTNGNHIFNEGSQDCDFRVESNDNAHMLFIDGGKNSVGIGTTPEAHYTGYVGLDIGLVTSLFSSASGTNITTLTNNGFLNSDASQWTYKVTDEATMYSQVHGDHRFSTAASGSADAAITWSEKVRFQAAGGISFNGDTAAANALDDYEEGTWIPTDASGQGITGFTLSHNQYTKIGRKVFAHCQITFPSSSNTTLARLSLPFAPNANSNNSATGGVCQEQNIGSSITVVAAVNYTNGVIFRPNGYGSYTYADLSGKTLRFAIHYNAS